MDLSSHVDMLRVYRGDLVSKDSRIKLGGVQLNVIARRTTPNMYCLLFSNIKLSNIDCQKPCG